MEMSMHTYILVDKEPVLEPDIRKWGQWMEGPDRIVARYYFDDGTWVSTVFLGLDHNWSRQGLPILFETMVFGPGGSGEDLAMDRYSTWAEAEEGHQRMVARVLAEKLLGEIPDEEESK